MRCMKPLQRRVLTSKMAR